MPRSLSQTARVFFNYETLIPFLLGSVFLSVLSNAVYQVFTNWFGTTTPVAIGIGLGALAIFALALWAFARAVDRMILRPMGGFHARRPAPRKGLILIMVSRLEPSRKAVEYHGDTLLQCWLICSPRTLPLARQLAGEFTRLTFPEPVVVNDINDPLEFRACVERIYERLPDGWQPGDVIADYVGMTAHGSVGMADRKSVV